MKRYVIVVVAVLVVLALVVAGCGRKQAGSNGIADVNGKAISYEDFAKQISQEPMFAQFVPQVLQKMLEDRLVLDIADKQGVAPTDEQVNQRIEFLKKTADLDAQLKQAGITLDEINKQLSLQQARINIEEKITKTKVTDAEVKKTYEQYKPFLYDLPERMRVKMLDFKDKAAADKAYKAIQGGSSLDKIGAVQDASHGTVRTNLIPKSGPNVPTDVAKAAFDTPKGKASQPLKISNPMMKQEFYLIIEPVEKLQPVKVSEKDADPIIRGQLYLQKSATDKDFEKLMSDARKTAKVQVSLQQFKKVETDFAKPPQPSAGMPMMMPTPGK